jgi:ribonuclease D
LDPLARLDLTPLWEVLRSHELILHGGDYDLRLFKKWSDFVPGSVFDTMLASRLLGCRQFGLSDLVSKYLGATLEKGPQKANWAKRPLTPRMEAYALNDTRYLHPLAKILREQLTEKGRLAWHAESCRRLIEDSTNIPLTDWERVWRVKGSHLLRPPALAVLRRLWQWREAQALRANRPPFFILTPETMVKLASAAVESKPLDPLLPKRMSPRRKHSLAQAVQEGQGDKHPPMLKRTRGQRPTEAEKRGFAELEKKRNAVAATLDIDPTLIASRANLIALAMDWDTHAPKLMKWQRKLLEV